MRQGSERSQYRMCYEALKDTGAPSPWKRLGDSTEYASALSQPTGKGAGLPFTHQLSSHHCFMAAFRGKKSLALLFRTVPGLSMLPARTQRVMGLPCIMVKTKGTRAGHQQHYITSHLSLSHTEARDSFLKCESDSGTSLFNRKGVWIMLKTSLAYFP